MRHGQEVVDGPPERPHELELSDLQRPLEP